MDERLVRRWASGAREIPSWVEAAVAAMLRERWIRLEALAVEVAGG